MKKTTIDEALIERAAQTVKALRQQKSRVVTAESCTAGLIAAVLSRAEGAGEVLEGSFVTYTKGQKEKGLGVDAGRMEREGCVTEHVVRQMAEGALLRSNADIVVAVSGVLGPDPDEDGNPVGLIYFCCLRRGGAPHIVRESYGAAHHDSLRRLAVVEALALVESGAVEPHRRSTENASNANFSRTVPRNRPSG